MNRRDRMTPQPRGLIESDRLVTETGTETGTGAAPRSMPLKAHDELPAGTRIGEHILHHELGRGGCGVVYRAEHRLLGRPAAIKVMHRELAASPEMVERFVREARAVNRIGHPGIVEIYDLGTMADGRPYQVMECLGGTSLSRVLREHGRLQPRDVLALLGPLCQALQAAHAAGIVHRDLKAGNIVVETAPAISRVTLLDFGVAKLMDPGPGGLVTSQGRILGTPHAMAPEQILGQAVDLRADIYALGVLLFHALTGRLPFCASDRTLLLEQHVASEPPRASEHAPVSPAFDAVIARAMAKRPEARFADARGLLHAVHEAARGSAPGRARPAQVTEKRLAVAVHVSARIAARGVVSGELLDRLGDVLDASEERLQAAGFAIVVVTRSAVLGVLVPGRPGLQAACECAIEAAGAMAASHRASQAQAPELELAVSVHAGDIEVRVDAAAHGHSAAQPARGALLDPRTWPAPRYDGQVHVTGEARVLARDSRAW